MKGSSGDSLSALLAMGPPKGGPIGDGGGDENEFDRSDDEPDELLIGAAQEVLAAMHSHDPESFAAALKSFVDMAG